MADVMDESWTAEALAARLGETDAKPRKQLRWLFRTLGPMVTWELVQTIERIEAHGGIVLPNGQRRTPGGIFFFLTRVGAGIKAAVEARNAALASAQAPSQQVTDPSDTARS
jgi:PHAX RNA-binding domain